MAREYILETAGGQVWEFNDPACPLSLHTDPTGLEGAKYTFDDQQNVNQAGVTFKARNDDPNFIGLDVKVGPVAKGDTAEELLTTWRQSLGRGTELHTFHSIGPNGDKFQVVRLMGDSLAPLNLTQMRTAGVLLHDKAVLRSDETWFRKTPAEAEFLAAGFGTASIDSVSDEPVWPYMVLTGPITNAVIGWEGETVAVGTVPNGDKWTINTDPDFWQITNLAGVDKSWIGDRWRKQIPAGDVTVPLTITGTGTSGVTKLEMTLPQLFRDGY